MDIELPPRAASWKQRPSIQLCAVECGAKCCKAPGFFFVTTPEMRRLKGLNKKAKFMRHESVWVFDHDFNGGQCVFLVDNMCSIYSDRPDACRKFPNKPYEDCLVWPKENDGD